MIAALSWRLLRRELRSGELRLLFAALLIAVAAVTAVGFFGDRVRQGLQREAQQMMGGDLVITADHPLPDSYRDEARRRNLRLAETLVAGLPVKLAELDALGGYTPATGQGYEQLLEKLGNDLAGCLESL